MDVFFQCFFFKIKKNILLLGRLTASLSSYVFKFLDFYILTLFLHSFGVVMFSRFFLFVQHSLYWLLLPSQSVLAIR